MGVKKTGKGRRKLGRKKRRMRAKNPAPQGLKPPCAHGAMLSKATGKRGRAPTKLRSVPAGTATTNLRWCPVLRTKGAFPLFPPPVVGPDAGYSSRW